MILMLLIVVAAHETGHLAASRDFGLNVTEMNIGFKIPFLEFISLHIQINGIGINFNPIFLGGYIAIPKEELNNIGLMDKIIIHGAGGLINIALGVMVLTALGIKNKIKISESIKQSLLFPISLLRTESMQETATGHKYTKLLIKINPSLLQKTFIYFSLASIIIGILNLLPIYPLDGGKIMFDVIAHFTSEKETEKVIMGLSLFNFFLLDQRKLIVRAIKK